MVVRETGIYRHAHGIISGDGAVGNRSSGLVPLALRYTLSLS